MKQAIIALVLAVIATPTWAGLMQDLDRCMQTTNPDLQISGCTAAIRSGQLNKQNLSAASNNRGLAYRSLSQYARAIEDFDRAIRLNAKNADAFNNRGDAFNSLSQYARAIEDFDQAIRLNPQFTYSFNNRGLAYLELGQYARAIEDFDKAIRLKPQYANAFSNRAIANKNLGQYAQAIEDYDEAIRLNPQEGAAFNNKAWLLATAPDSRIRNGRDAVQAALQAVELDSGANRRNTLAAAYAEDGQFSKAVEQQKLAIQMLRDEGHKEEIPEYESRLRLFGQGRPYRDISRIWLQI